MPTPTSTAMPEAGVLRMAGFRRLWSSDVVDGLGSQFATLALSVTAVVVVRASALQVGVLTAVGQGAYLVLGLPAGVWIDRWSKKRTLVITAFVEAVAVASVPIVFLAGSLMLWQLVVVAAIVSTTSLLFDTAHSAILPPLVGRDHVSEASARLQTADSALRVIGPGLAGQLLRIVSGPILYVVTAALGATSAVISSTIDVDEPRHDKVDRERFRASLFDGIRFVVRHPVLRTFMLASSSINFGAGMFAAVMPVFVLRELSISAADWGLAISFGALGGIAGSLLGLRVKSRFGELRAMLVLAYLLPLAFGAGALAGVVPLPPVLLIALSETLFGMIVVMYTICSSGVRARVTPAEMFGRVSSASRFVTLGIVPLGAVIGGAIASGFGNYAALILAVLSAAAAPIVFTASPLRAHRSLPRCKENVGD